MPKFLTYLQRKTQPISCQTFPVARRMVASALNFPMTEPEHRLFGRFSQRYDRAMSGRANAPGYSECYVRERGRVGISVARQRW
jgi:hypothetical protein